MNLEFGFPPYPKLCDFTLWRRNGNCLVSVVWTITTCWPSVPIMIAGLLLSVDAYMAYREWGFLMPMSACTNREGWRETASLSTANSCLLVHSAMASASYLFSPITKRMYEGIIFPRPNIYIYIYTHWCSELQFRGLKDWERKLNSHTNDRMQMAYAKNSLAPSAFHFLGCFRHHRLTLTSFRALW